MKKIDSIISNEAETWHLRALVFLGHICKYLYGHHSISKYGQTFSFENQVRLQQAKELQHKIE